MATTLREFVANMDPDTVMYIGADNGYFYIGTKEGCIERIEKLDEKYHERLVRAARYKGNALRRCKGEYPLIQKHEFSVRRAYLATWRRVLKQLRTAERFLNEYQPLLDREVKDTYNKFSTPGISVIVDGRYSGITFWFLHEYENHIHYGGRKKTKPKPATPKLNKKRGRPKKSA